MIVVTAPEDKETRRMCEFWHVETVLTDAFESRWNKFCKGKGINAGLKKLEKTDWVLHLDADIVLPPLTRRLLEKMDLDPSFVYGIDRHIVPNYKSWRKFLEKPPLQQENRTFVHADRFRIGTRVAPEHFDGYLPIGFFQLWNPKASGVTEYPDQHLDAGRGDMLFAAKWPRNKRAFIPEIIGYHIESEVCGVMGANWDGRKTPPFTCEDYESDGKAAA